MRINYELDLFDRLFSVLDYNPPVPDVLNILQSSNSHLAVYIIAPIAGVLVLSLIIIVLVHKFVRPIPPVTSLIRRISSSTIVETGGGGDVEMQVLPPGAGQPSENHTLLGEEGGNQNNIFFNSVITT